MIVLFNCFQNSSLYGEFDLNDCYFLIGFETALLMGSLIKKSSYIIGIKLAGSNQWDQVSGIKFAGSSQRDQFCGISRGKVGWQGQLAGSSQRDQASGIKFVGSRASGINLSLQTLEFTEIQQQRDNQVLSLHYKTHAFWSKLSRNCKNLRVKAHEIWSKLSRN